MAVIVSPLLIRSHRFLPASQSTRSVKVDPEESNAKVADPRVLHGELHAKLVHEAEVKVQKVRERPGLVRVSGIVFMSSCGYVGKAWSGGASVIEAEFKLNLERK